MHREESHTKLRLLTDAAPALLWLAELGKEAGLAALSPSYKPLSPPPKPARVAGPLLEPKWATGKTTSAPKLRSKGGASACHH